MTNVELTDEDAIMFLKFRERQALIGYLVGYMDSLKLVDLRNMSITMDTDNNGMVGHTSITRHFRK